MTGAHPWSPVLTGRGQPEPIPGLKATPSLFSLLRAPAALGQVFTSADDVVVLSHRLWQRRFAGDAGIVGQTLTLDGKPYAVVGVMPPGFEFPPFWATGAEMWTPLRLTAEDESNESRMLRVFARLRSGATLAAARAEMELVEQRLVQERPSSHTGVAVNVEALQEPVVSQVRPALWMLMGAVGLVLLIACANVTSLLLAQGLGREREIALRIALGADRAEILRELLTDSVVLALVRRPRRPVAGEGGDRAPARLEPAGVPPPRRDRPRRPRRGLQPAPVPGRGPSLGPGARAARLAGRPHRRLAARRSGGEGRRQPNASTTCSWSPSSLSPWCCWWARVSSPRASSSSMNPRPGFRTDDLLTLSVSFSSSPFRAPERQPLFIEDLSSGCAACPG